MFYDHGRIFETWYSSMRQGKSCHGKFSHAFVKLRHHSLRWLSLQSLIPSAWICAAPADTLHYEAQHMSAEPFTTLHVLAMQQLVPPRRPEIATMHLCRSRFSKKTPQKLGDNGLLKLNSEIKKTVAHPLASYLGLDFHKYWARRSLRAISSAASGCANRRLKGESFFFN